MEFHRFSLSNGVRVIAAPMTSASIVAVQVLFSCGSRAEEDNEIGKAHMNEHMFFRGGRDFPDSKSVERERWLLGDISSAVTSLEHVHYYIIVSSKFLERAVHLLSDMLVYARFNAEDLEKERGAVIRELKQIPDDPERLSYEAFLKLFFGDHPLGRTFEDELGPVTGFSADDVRGFKERFYGPPNMVISIAGGIDVSEAGELLERYFGAVSYKEVVSWKKFNPVSCPEPARFVERKELEGSYLWIGSPAPSYLGKDAMISLILNQIFNKRLWFKIRDERGLAYDVGSMIWSYSDTGVLCASIDVSNDNRDVEKSIRLLFEEMVDIRDGGITEQEFYDAKTSFYSQFDLSLVSPSNISWFFGSHELLYDAVKSISQVHREIEEVTRDRVISLSQDLWQEEQVRALLLSPGFPQFEKTYCKLRSVLK